jgi:hypothetical protein
MALRIRYRNIWLLDKILSTLLQVLSVPVSYKYADILCLLLLYLFLKYFYGCWIVQGRTRYPLLCLWLGEVTLVPRLDVQEALILRTQVLWNVTFSNFLDFSKERFACLAWLQSAWELKIAELLKIALCEMYVGIIRINEFVTWKTFFMKTWNGN